MLLNNRIPAYFILNKVKYDMVYVFLVSVTVLLITYRFHAWLPEIPLTITAFIGTAITVLLSFKLSQSYDRWWDGRKVWGAIVNDSRSFEMQLQNLLPDGNKTTIKKIALRQIAWCCALGRSLRGLNATEDLESYITREELEELKRHQNKPLALLQLHGKDLKTLKEKKQPDPFTLLQLDNTLVRLCDAQGKSERIKTTVFPVTYRLFLHGNIYLFIVTLSIAIKDLSWVFECCYYSLSPQRSFYWKNRPLIYRIRLRTNPQIPL
jgi:putative membrane protein